MFGLWRGWGGFFVSVPSRPWIRIGTGKGFLSTLWSGALLGTGYLTSPYLITLLRHPSTRLHPLSPTFCTACFVVPMDYILIRRQPVSLRAALPLPLAGNADPPPFLPSRPSAAISPSRINRGSRQNMFVIDRRWRLVYFFSCTGVCYQSPPFRFTPDLNFHSYSTTDIFS